MGKRTPNPKPRIHQNAYDTPIKALLPLIPYLNPKDRFWEPCAGRGVLADALADAGFYIVGATDIEPRDERVTQLAALDLTVDYAKFADTFITNPPWPEPRRNGEPALSILHHLSGLRPTWALLSADFMHNVYAEPLMAACSKIVSIGRVKWFEGTEHDGMDNCAWYLFGPGSRPRPTHFYTRNAATLRSSSPPN